MNDYLNSSQQITAKEATKHTLRKGLWHAILFGLGVLIIWLVSSKYLIIGKIGFWAYFSWISINTVILLISVSLSLFIYFASSKNYNSSKDKSSFNSVLLIRIIDHLICCFYTYILYQLYIFQ